MGPGLPRGLLAFTRSQGITGIVTASVCKSQESVEPGVRQNQQREKVDTTTPRLGPNAHRNMF